MDQPTAIYVPCPEPEMISRYASGSLDEQAAEWLCDHLRDCHSCRRSLDELA